MSRNSSIPSLREIRTLLADAGRTPLARNALSLYAGRLGSFVLGAVSLVLFGVLLAKPEIATVALFEMVMGLLVTLGFRWSAVGLVRFGKEEHIQAGSMRLTSSVRLGIILPILAAFSVLLVAFREPLLRYLGTDDGCIVQFLILDLVAIVARDHLAALFSAAERHYVNAAVYVGMSVGKLISLVLLWIGVVPVSAETYIKLLVIVDVATIIPQVVWLDRSYLWPPVLPDRAALSRMMRFVLPQVYGFAALYILSWVDTYFIRLYLSSEELGGYQFVYSIFLKAAAPAVIFNTLLFPRIISWNQSSVERTRRYTQLAPLLMFAATGALALLSLALADPLLARIFGGKYSEAAQSFHLMLAALPFVYLYYVYVPVLNARDRVVVVQLGNVGAAAANIAIDFVLVERFGIIGAALGTFASLQLRALLMMVVVHRMTGVGCLRLLAASLFAGAGVLAYFARITGAG